jgi:hypothetical protein
MGGARRPEVTGSGSGWLVPMVVRSTHRGSGAAPAPGSLQRWQRAGVMVSSKATTRGSSASLASTLMSPLANNLFVSADL